MCIRHFWLGMMFLFTLLAGCSAQTTLNGLSATHDPDGDGDAKGLNYFPPTRPATGNHIFVFDPNYDAWALYDDDGTRINTGRASGGKSYCADIGRSCRTIVGRFTILSKGGANCKSTKYPVATRGGAPTPYCMRFSSKGYAIHGSNDVPDYNASHGCVRVTPVVAEWLSSHFIDIGTTVIVLPYR